MHIDDATPVLRDIVQGKLELLLAVASERSQHLRRQTLIMHSDRHPFQARPASLPYVRVRTNQPWHIVEKVDARSKVLRETELRVIL